MLDFKLFQGTISNCNKQVLSSVRGSTDLSKRVTVGTKHEHYTTFDIGNVTFQCYGEYPLRDGDKVVLYASRTNEGYYRVENLKNFTRNYFIRCTAMGFGVIMLWFCAFGGVGLWMLMFLGLILDKSVSYEYPGLLGLSSSLAIGFLFHMFVLLPLRKKVAAFNEEIANYPEFK